MTEFLVRTCSKIVLWLRQCAWCEFTPSETCKRRESGNAVSFAAIFSSVLLLLMTQSALSETATYVYDSLGRLKSVTYDDSTSVTYQLDSAGNRTGVVTTSPDHTAPDVPSGLAASAPSATQVHLTWSASSDNGGSGTTGYNIYRNGSSTPINTSSTTSYDDLTVAGSTAYTYKVAAYDAAGNTSAQSGAVSVTTPAPPDTTPPTIPANLRSTFASSTKITLTWDVSTDAGSGMQGYRVYKNGSLVPGTIVSPPWDDSSVAGTTAYSYKVTAIDKQNNESAASNTLSITTPDTLPPNVPTGLQKDSATATQVTFHWTPPTDPGGSGIGGYYIYRDGAQINTASTSSFTDNTVSGTRTYSYAVAAFDRATPTANTSGLSATLAISTPDTTKPDAPGNLVATVISAHEIDLVWNVSKDQDGSYSVRYRIYRNGAFVTDVTAPAAGATQAAFNNSSIPDSSTYTYYVTAFDAAGNESLQSNSVTRSTPDATPPGVPTITSITAPAPKQVSLWWTQVSDNSGGAGVAGYQIFRNGSYLTTVSGASNTSYSDTSVSGSTYYTYQVNSFDSASNYSSLSTSAGVTTPLGVPDPPVLSAPSGRYTAPLTFTVSWTASATATTYELYEVNSDSTGSYALVYSGSGTSTSRTRGRGSWNYKVRACNSAGCGGYSNTKTVLICSATGSCPP